MNRRCAEIPVGSEGVLMLPSATGGAYARKPLYGGRSDRAGSQPARSFFHLLRAAQEGIALRSATGWTSCGDRVAAPGDPGRVCESVPQSRVPADVGYPVCAEHRIIQYRRGFGRRPGAAVSAPDCTLPEETFASLRRSTKCVPILRTGMWDALESRTGKPARDTRWCRNWFEIYL